jgi:hypothetical protein
LPPGDPALEVSSPEPGRVVASFGYSGRPAQCSSANGTSADGRIAIEAVGQSRDVRLSWSGPDDGDADTGTVAFEGLPTGEYQVSFQVCGLVATRSVIVQGVAPTASVRIVPEGTLAVGNDVTFRAEIASNGWQIRSTAWRAGRCGSESSSSGDTVRLRIDQSGEWCVSVTVTLKPTRGPDVTVVDSDRFTVEDTTTSSSSTTVDPNTTSSTTTTVDPNTTSSTTTTIDPGTTTAPPETTTTTAPPDTTTTTTTTTSIVP